MESLVSEYDITGYVRERSGSILPGIAPSNAYPCAGGDLILIGGNGDTVYARLSKAVPASRVFRAPDMLEDPQFIAREAIVTTDHAVFGKIRMQNVFPKLSRK